MKDAIVESTFANDQQLPPPKHQMPTESVANPDALIIMEMLPHATPEALRMARAMITGQAR